MSDAARLSREDWPVSTRPMSPAYLGRMLMPAEPAAPPLFDG